MAALITGAGRGIGLRLAQALFARGDSVIATTRGTPPELPPVEWHHADVTDAVTLRALAQAMGDRPLDLLVCNAGVYLDRGLGLEAELAPALWAQSFAVNATGVFLSVEALLPSLRRAKAAKIAIISSQMGSSSRATGGAAYAYRASKAAAVNIGLNLAAELRAEGIAVGIYHPGWVRTGMGGSSAEIDPEESAAGLLQRFDALDMATTGSFLNWDGREMPV